MTDGTAARPLFEILPSIDVRAGKVVDLYQGDYARETVYDESAVSVAERFLAAGARWLHVVDLDGSRSGAGANRELVAQIVGVARQGGASVELGGGIRTLDDARAALEVGVNRVIFGTAAVERPEVVEAAVRAFGPAAVVVGVDARGGLVATRGWTQASARRAVDLANEMVERGVPRFICTDITRDSTLTEPNFDSLAELARGVPAAVIASGGVTTVEQIARLRSLDLEGAVVGSALYAGRLTLEAALEAAQC